MGENNTQSFCCCCCLFGCSVGWLDFGFFENHKINKHYYYIHLFFWWKVLTFELFWTDIVDNVVFLMMMMFIILHKHTSRWQQMKTKTNNNFLINRFFIFCFVWFETGWFKSDGRINRFSIFFLMLIRLLFNNSIIPDGKKKKINNYYREKEISIFSEVRNWIINKKTSLSNFHHTENWLHGWLGE